MLSLGATSALCAWPSSCTKQPMIPQGLGTRGPSTVPPAPGLLAFPTGPSVIRLPRVGTWTWEALTGLWHWGTIPTAYINWWSLCVCPQTKGAALEVLCISRAASGSCSSDAT